MKCPQCSLPTKVRKSDQSKYENGVVYRTRECQEGHRFLTIEREKVIGGPHAGRLIALYDSLPSKKKKAMWNILKELVKV